MARPFLIVGLFAVSCYNPSVKDCVYTCETNTPEACPDGLTCTKGFCVADPAHPPGCVTDAPLPDAPVDRRCEADLPDGCGSATILSPAPNDQMGQCFALCSMPTSGNGENALMSPTVGDWHPAVVGMQPDEDAVKKLVMDGPGAWIGVRRTDAGAGSGSAGYTQFDGTPLNTSFFAPGAMLGSGARCVFVTKDGWLDDDCTTNMRLGILSMKQK